MPSTIRLALVITELAVGGAEKCLFHLATKIDRARFAPVVYSLKPRPKPGKDLLVAQLEAAGIPTHFLGLRSSWQVLAGVKSLKAMLKEQQPQIVHNFMFHANVIGTLAARKAGASHTVMGIRVADPRRWRVQLERVLSKKVDRVVCVSRSVADLCQSRGFDAGKLVEICNGVDTELFNDVAPADVKKLGIPAGRRLLTFIGRLDEQKGMPGFLNLMAPVLRDLPEHDLLLVGEGPLRQSLAQEAQQLKLENRVHFAGWRPDIPAILAASEMLVLPSKWEGMPNVVLEAMAAGKPVAATRAEGVMELLGAEAEGQTAPREHREGLGNVIRRFAQNPQDAEQVGWANKQRVSKCFSLGAMIAQYEELYGSLMAGESGRKIL